MSGYVLSLLVLLSALGCTFADVRLPPQITIQPKTSIVFVSDDEALLECEAKGVPDVQFYWEKNGADFSLNRQNVKRIAEDKGSFLIKPTTSLDEGYYQCFAKNTYGTALSKVAALHKATLAPFPPSTGQEYKANEGDPLKVPCLQTKSYPPPEYSWVVADGADDPNPTKIELSKRIQQDIEGSLYFSNVEGTDMQGGKIYKCAIYNPQTELTRTGSYSTIKVTPGSPASARPANVFSTPSPTIGLVGREIELQCLFSGFPTPNVKWSRVGGSLPVGRHQKTDYDTTLKITELRFEDEGDYRCEGSNSVDTNAISIQLNVQSVPVFESKEKQPHNINKTQGESVSFFCDASGEPTPGVVWLKNGVPLDLNTPGPRMKISADHKNLTIHDLCKDCGNDETDLMVIQCNSSNVHGYAYSEGYLNVLLKTMLTVMPEDISMLDWEGEELIFKCEAASDDSTPILFTWLFNGVELDQARPEYEVHQDGLHIFPKKMDDPNKIEGLYTCVANNGMTSAKHDAQLTVPDEPAPVVTEGAFPWWIIILIIVFVVVLFIIILCICCCLWCQRNRGDEYPVDEKERAAGRDPEKEILDGGFQDYQRPEEQPFKGSRASLTSTIKLNDSDDESMAEYGEPDTGKFNEDGSFIGQYTEKQKPSRAGDSVV